MRKRKIAVLLCLASSLGCNRFTQPKLAEIPLLSCSSLPLVEVSLNGSPPVRMFLDFAGDFSYISEAAAHQAKIAGAVQHDEYVKGHLLSRSLDASVKIGSVILHEPLTIGYTDREPFPPGDGGLSYKAFRGRLVILDIPHKRLKVSIDTI